jgi:hypothetical protein
MNHHHTKVKEILNRAAAELAALLGHPVTIIPHNHDYTNIVLYAAYYFKLSAKDIKSEKRHRPLVMARTAIVYLITALEPTKSLASIGHEIDRDHATVLNIRKKYLQDIEVDKAYEATVNKFIQSYIAGMKDYTMLGDEVDKVLETAKEVAHVPVNFKLKEALVPFMEEPEEKLTKKD